jgi:hypothetical protein
MADLFGIVSAVDKHLPVLSNRRESRAISSAIQPDMLAPSRLPKESALVNFALKQELIQRKPILQRQPLFTSRTV